MIAVIFLGLVLSTVGVVTLGVGLIKGHLYFEGQRISDMETMVNDKLVQINKIK